MSARSIIKLIISGDTKGANRALRQTRSEAKSTGSSIKSLAKIGAIGFGALAAAVVDFGKHAVSAAEDEQDAHVHLLTALKNTHQAWKDQKDAIEGADKSSVQFGYDTAQTEQALADAESATGNTAKSLVYLAIAQNIAAESGKDLHTVLLAVIKGSEGQTRPLKQLGIDLPVAAGGAENVKKALLALAAANANLEKVQKSQASKGTDANTKADERLKKAQDRLVEVEDKLKGKRWVTVAQQHELASAQDAITAAQMRSAPSTDAVGSALVRVQKAQQNLNDTQHAGDAITKALADKYSGQATAGAKTFKGELKALGAEFTNFEANVGTKIIPVITKLMKIIADPKTFQDAEAGFYVVEKAVVEVANAAVDLVNLFLEIERLASAPHNFLSKLGIGKSVNIPNDYQHFGLPKEPNLGNPTTTLTPAAKAIIAKNNAPGDSKSSGLYDPNFGKPNQAVVHVTHIHANGAQAPRVVAAQLQRQQRRNGRTDFLKPYRVTPPESL